MAKRRTDSNRRDLATWLMMLLPGFMFVGLLAPAAVNVKPKARGGDRPDLVPQLSRRAARSSSRSQLARRAVGVGVSSRCSRARATSSTRRSA